MEQSYLWEKLGPTVQQALQDDSVFEVMLNPDGTLWLKHQREGDICVGSMAKDDAAAFVNAIAQQSRQYLNEERPYCDATLPFSGERIAITIAPITENPSFNIRKKAKLIYTLDDYKRAEIISSPQVEALKQAIRERKNILVSGSPASGKTTLTNALLDYMAQVIPSGQRVLLLEQVTELQCQVKNVKAMLTCEGASMNTLLFIAMRSSPDRIVVGEVRDGAALDMLKAWNTGCPGGLATIHANHPRAALQRVLDLACEAISTPPTSLAGEAIDVIVQINSDASHPAGRIVSEIIGVDSYDTTSCQFQLFNYVTKEILQ